jgi:hypothetical protein
MGLKVGYNLVAIVIIDVPASVGPKPLIPLLRHMSRLKGRFHPQGFRSRVGREGFFPLASCRPHLSVLALLTIGCKL